MQRKCGARYSQSRHALHGGTESVATQTDRGNCSQQATLDRKENHAAYSGHAAGVDAGPGRPTIFGKQFIRRVTSHALLEATGKDIYRDALQWRTSVL